MKYCNSFEQPKVSSDDFYKWPYDWTTGVRNSLMSIWSKFYLNNQSTCTQIFQLKVLHTYVRISNNGYTWIARDGEM